MLVLTDDLDEVAQLDELDELSYHPIPEAPSMTNATIRSNAEVERQRPESGTALRRAFDRAEARKTELLNSPEWVNGETLAQELGVSRATVDNRRVAGKLLAVEFGAKRGIRFPLWQRDLLEDRPIREAFESTLERLGRVGTWSRYRFFVHAAPELEGATPIEAIKDGQTVSVWHSAETWAAGEQGGG